MRLRCWASGPGALSALLFVRRDRYAHAFACGELHMRLVLDPVRMLEPQLSAVEAVYPAVQERHRAKLARIEKLSHVSPLREQELKLRIDSCVGLRSRPDGQGPPDPSIRAEFIRILRNKGDGAVLHTCDTTRKGGTCDPTWNEAFTLQMLPLKRVRLRLTVQNHDPGGTVDRFWGKVHAPHLRARGIGAAALDMYISALGSCVHAHSLHDSTSVLRSHGASRWRWI